MANVQDTRQGFEMDIRSSIPRGMAPEQVQQQIEQIVSQGWCPAVEHIEPERSFNPYWHIWKQSGLESRSVTRVHAELEACHREYPAHHVRLIGYDEYASSRSRPVVVYRGT